MQAADGGEAPPPGRDAPYAARDLASLVGASVPAAEIAATDGARGADEPQIAALRRTRARGGERDGTAVETGDAPASARLRPVAVDPAEKVG